MIDNNKLVHEIFDEFSKIERVRILSDSDKKKLNIPIAIVAWEIETEIDLGGTCCEFTFHISFKSSFPLDFPKIYLSPLSYEKAKYLPHIDSNRFVCTFDPEICSTNISEPLGIVIECLKRAKKIIQQGILNTNQNEYDEEFIAYWEDKYDSAEKKPIIILSLIDKNTDNSPLKLICLDKNPYLYEYILHLDDDTARPFKNFLTEN
ncbi:MAG: E2/UBC family protein, partial [Bacteroidota bacterium]